MASERVGDGPDDSAALAPVEELRPGPRGDGNARSLGHRGERDADDGSTRSPTRPRNDLDDIALRLSSSLISDRVQETTTFLLATSGRDVTVTSRTAHALVREGS